MRSRLGFVLFCIVGAAALLAGCGGGGGSTTTAQAPAPGTGKATGVGGGGGGVKLTKVGDLTQPLYGTQPSGGGDLFVVQRTGAIRVIHDGKVKSQPFLDLAGKITTTGQEQGLLSMAFAPDYAKSGLFYVDYTATNGDTRAVEYRRSAGDPLRADPASAPQVLAGNHPFE